ncbi:MAG: Ig-like domain-containing protein [Clostridia bacterium]|nr:Ig-like domain-containing protein [Clostridia bacterium]
MRKLYRKITPMLLIVALLFGQESLCTFAGELPQGGTVSTIDYQTVTDTSSYAHAFAGWSTEGTSTATVTGGVLNWTTSNYGDRNTYALMTIPLEEEIDIANGPFTVSVKAKLPNAAGRRIRGFAILGGNTDATYSTADDTLMGMAQLDDKSGYMLEAGQTELWMNKQDDGTSVNNSSDYNNVGTTTLARRFFISQADANSDYYTYRWNVDPETQTFRFFYQQEGDTEWTEPYGDLYMMNTNTTEQNDRFAEAGVMPTGTLPAKIKALKFRQYEYDVNNIANSVTTYIKSISVEQGVQRPTVTAVTVDGLELSDNENVPLNGQIDISFDSEVFAGSVTKANISMSQVIGGAAVAEDVYTLEQSADKQVISIKFNDGKSLEYSTKYKLKISGIKADTQLQAEMNGGKEILFTTTVDPDAPDGAGGFEGTIDFSELTTDDVKNYETGLAAGAETETTFAIAEGALEIKTVGGANDNPTHYPKIPLDDLSVNTENGAFSILIKAKFYSNGDVNVRNFPTLSDGTNKFNFGLGWCTGQTISSKNLGLLMNANNRSDGMWSFKAEQKIENSEDAKVGRTDNNVNIIKDADRYFLGLNEASADYYTYKWDVDPVSKTFRFYYSADDGATWTEPYAEFNMINPYTSAVGDRFEEKGVFPTGNLPATLTHLQYEQRVAKGETTVISIASIGIEQKSCPAVETIKAGSITLTDNITDIEPAEQIDITFDRMVRPDSVSRDGIYLVDEESGERVSEDIYTLVQSADFETISIIFNTDRKLDYLKKYTLVISKVKAYTRLQGEIKGVKKLSFTTLSTYDARNLSVDATSETDKVKFEFDLKDYVKENNGQKYVVVVALVESLSNTTYAVKAVSDMSVDDGQIIKTTHYPFEFVKPENFTAENFEVRIYVWDGFENSINLLKKVKAL